ncbi:MFS transporter [Nevskia soli]|uniref:MFS transporter n=1 Tax=Nevskia soli TaxID=418856 RepID=UPI0004A75DF4|nr:MFS transporter [Nevskia soli]
MTSKAEPHDSRECHDVAAKLDTLPWNRFHTVAILVLGVGWALDSFEVTLISNIIGILKDQWRLNAAQMSWILGAWFVGLMIGAYGFGVLSDRYGRKRIFLTSLSIYGLFTALTAAAPGYSTFLVLRFITAIGVGAEYAAINAAVSEFIPASFRGRAGALVMNLWTVGAIAASLVAMVLLAVLPPELAWRAVFIVGAFIALSTLVLRRHLPESPRWLLLQQQRAAASAIIDGISRGQVRFDRIPAIKMRVPSTKADGESKILKLLRLHPGRLALGCALDFAEAAGYYGLFAFIPLVALPMLKLDATAIPLFYLAGNAGALVGGLVVAWLLDRAGRKLTVTACYGLTALAMLGVAAVSSWGTSWIIAGFVVANVLATASWVGAYPTFTELFPTSLRATGVGASVAVGRIGAFSAPFSITAAAERFGISAALVLLAGYWFLGLVAMLIWNRTGVEARGMSLEALVGESVR